MHAWPGAVPPAQAKTERPDVLTHVRPLFIAPVRSPQRPPRPAFGPAPVPCTPSIGVYPIRQKRGAWSSCRSSTFGGIERHGPRRIDQSSRLAGGGVGSSLGVGGWVYHAGAPPGHRGPRGPSSAGSIGFPSVPGRPSFRALSRWRSPRAAARAAARPVSQAARAVSSAASAAAASAAAISAARAALAARAAQAAASAARTAASAQVAAASASSASTQSESAAALAAAARAASTARAAARAALAARAAAPAARTALPPARTPQRWRSRPRPRLGDTRSGRGPGAGPGVRSGRRRPRWRGGAARPTGRGGLRCSWFGSLRRESFAYPLGA